MDQNLIKIEDACQFREQVGILTAPQFIHGLTEIPADSFSGIYYKERLQDLMQFCSKNPEYHIVSLLPDGVSKINRASIFGSLYFLAKGDSNPRLAFVYDSPEKNPFVALQKSLRDK